MGLWLMTQREKQLLSRWTGAAYFLICVALVLVVVIGAWGAYRDLTLVRTTLLQSEIATLRSQALRRAGHLESGLEASGKPIAVEISQNNSWLRNYWPRIVESLDAARYAAIVDDSWVVVLHSQRQLQGKKLGRRWYDRVVSEAGEDVLEVHNSALTGGKHAYDVRIPLLVNGREVGEYHEGLDATWIEQRMADKRNQILGRWAIVIGGIFVSVSLAAISLLYIATRKAALSQAVNLARTQRLTEVGQLAVGLAHEVRNPLHAIRLNLHAFGRSQDGASNLSQDDVRAMIEESCHEVERIDQLMRELLGFANPEAAKDEDVNLNSELQAALNFIARELSRKRVHLTTNFPEKPLYARIDPARLRQIILNLLMNSLDAVEEGGCIELRLAPRSGEAEITVCDDGRGISEDDRQHVFEPFFSTKSDSSGLGLAVVNRFVDEAGGQVSCEPNSTSRTKFVVLLPMLAKSKKRSNKT